MKTIGVKNHVFGNCPRVVGIIDAAMGGSRLKSFAERGIDIFEIRADLFNRPVNAVIDYVNAQIKATLPHVPLIGTIRETASNRADLVDWYVSLAKCVDIIDIELGMPRWRDIVYGISRPPYPSAQTPAAIMVSEHDFNKTPSVSGLKDIVRRSVDQGAQIVKIAATANCGGDVIRLMNFTENCDVPLVTMAMGDAGKISRIIAPLFGSLFSYGYLRKPLVPGQLSALKLVSAYNDYYPGRKGLNARQKGSGTK